jgi:hypothetical protein
MLLLFGVATAALCLALVGCNLGSGAALERVPEGKLAPPGSELLSESSQGGNVGEAAALRRYAAHDLTTEQVASFYEQKLGAEGWRREEPTTRKDQMIWTDGKHVIVLNLSTDQFLIVVQENCCER